MESHTCILEGSGLEKHVLNEKNKYLVFISKKFSKLKFLVKLTKCRLAVCIDVYVNHRCIGSYTY